MRISDWSSDVCSSDLKSYVNTDAATITDRMQGRYINGLGKAWDDKHPMRFHGDGAANFPYLSDGMWFLTQHKRWGLLKNHPDYAAIAGQIRSEEHTSELQSLMRTSYAVFCLNTKKHQQDTEI